MKAIQVQKEVAASADELLEIAEGIGRLVEGYGKEDWDSISLKRRILQERCRRLEDRLKKAQAGLDEAEGNSQGEDRSIAVTRQLIAQNLLILKDRESLLQSMERHADVTESLQEGGKTLEREASIRELANELRDALEIG